MMIPHRLVVHESNVRHDLDPRSHRQDHSQNLCMGCNFSLLISTVLSWIWITLQTGGIYEPL